LETNWGKNILSHVTGESSHNLFNIKADSKWDKGMVAKSAKEIENGVAINKKSNFRSYESFEDSFKDYVSFLQKNPRYQQALKHAGEPEKFVHSLQKAHFATDPEYGNKILQIYNSKAFDNFLGS
jgi:flagellar protein FlgJ